MDSCSSLRLWEEELFGKEIKLHSQCGEFEEKMSQAEGQQISWEVITEHPD